MRNKFAGECCVCGDDVGVGKGFFERKNRAWRVRHVHCQTKKKRRQIKGE